MWGSGLKAQGLGSNVLCFRFRIKGSWLMVDGFWLRV